MVGPAGPTPTSADAPLLPLPLSVYLFSPLPFLSPESLAHSQWQLRTPFLQLLLSIREENKREKKDQVHQVETSSPLSLVSLIFEFLCSCCSFFVLCVLQTRWIEKLEVHLGASGEHFPSAAPEAAQHLKHLRILVPKLMLILHHLPSITPRHPLPNGKRGMN